MLKKGTKVNVYKIKEILSEENTHVCCLTEDPFFHNSVLLKIYPVDFLENQLQREQFGALLEKIFLIEHPAIAPVLDSGFEGESFYYTTNYNHQAPLLDRAAEGLSSEETLKVVRDLASALEYAFGQDLVHGSLALADIYFGDDAQAIIADFGVGYSFKHFTESPQLEWSEEQALKDLGRLQLQLLRPSSTDNQGRELELLAGIENQRLKRLGERFFIEDEDCYRSFSELIDALDALLEQPPVETRPMVQKKSLQVCPDTGISRQQREQVLPHVRQLISEKNHYKTLLDEARLGQNKTACQLKQTQLELDQFATLQLEAPPKLAAENRKKVVVWALGGFILGIIMSGSYGYTLQQKNIQQVAQETVVAKQVATVLVEPSVQQDLPVVVEQSVLLEAEVVNNDLQQDEKNASIPVVKEETVPVSGQSKKADSPITVIAEQPQQWWPAGQEFAAEVAVLKGQGGVAVSAVDRLVSAGLSEAECDAIFHDLLLWLDSWSEQNPAAYFSHYSDQYRPDLGKSREEWSQSRRSRLLRPGWIKVQAQDISIQLLGEKQVQVKFQQIYRSDFYQDTVFKSLNLINENGSWKILTERSMGKIDFVASS
ncbi:MAG: protein kinase [Desulfuromusa sp.]|nr:protein kinase [Desulfuromusa sp.]